LFWISNPGNNFSECVAVGGVFGFWYVMPVSPIGSSANMYSTTGIFYIKQDQYVRPRWTPLGLFDNNVAHGNHDSGLFVDEMLNSDGTATGILLFSLKTLHILH
jgi:hypothetical protein